MHPVKCRVETHPVLDPIKHKVSIGLDDVIRILPACIWHSLNYLKYHTIALAQTSKTLRTAVLASRMPVSVCAQANQLETLLRQYDVVNLQLQSLGQSSKVVDTKYESLAKGSSCHILNLLTFEDEKSLLHSLHFMPKLEKLDVSSLNVGGWIYSYTLFRNIHIQCKALTELNLSNNGIELKSDVQCIQQVICRLPLLQRLDLSGNLLDSDDACNIITNCNFNDSMTDLNLSNNNLLFAGNFCFAPCSLKRLNLSNCVLGGGDADDGRDTDAEDIATMIANYKSLSALDLSGNELSFVHADAIAETLLYDKCTWLTRLDLTSNEKIPDSTKNLIKHYWKGTQNAILVDP